MVYTFVRDGSRNFQVWHMAKFKHLSRNLFLNCLIFYNTINPSEASVTWFMVPAAARCFSQHLSLNHNFPSWVYCVPFLWLPSGQLVLHEYTESSLARVHTRALAVEITIQSHYCILCVWEKMCTTCLAARLHAKENMESKSSCICCWLAVRKENDVIHRKPK